MPELFVLRAKPVVVVTARDVKLMVRVALLVRSTPMPAAFLLTVVAANEMLAFEPSMSMPLPPGFVMDVAPGTVTGPPPVPCRKPTPVLPDVVIDAKVRVPAELFCKEIASLPPVTVVAPKLRSAVVVPIRMPCVVLPETLVLPNENAPTPESATPARLMP